MTEANKQTREAIWVLADTSPEGELDPQGSSDLLQYRRSFQIDPERLREHIQSFASAMSEALQGVTLPMANFELSEVTIQASLNAELGFVLVAKGGIEGGMQFTFAKKGK